MKTYLYALVLLLPAHSATADCSDQVTEYMSQTAIHSFDTSDHSREHLLSFKQLFDLNAEVLQSIQTDSECVGESGRALVCVESHKLLVTADEYKTQFIVKRQDEDTWSPIEVQSVASMERVEYLHYVVCMLPNKTSGLTPT